MKFWITIGLILVLSALGLTYEIAAGRVLAPFFGTSLLTWTTVIAVVLAGFSLGSALGGLVAERERPVAAAALRKALTATAVLMALSPTVLGLIYAWGARGTWGMSLAVVLAFFPASVLVSFPSPFLAKLAVEARPEREGSSLGIVLAAGSLGAIVGAILAGFVALPLVGSVATFAGCGLAALLCIPFIKSGAPGEGGKGEGSAARASYKTVASIAVAAVLIMATMASGAVCRYESGLSCIDVVRQGRVIYLYSDRTLQAAEQTVPQSEQAETSRSLVMPYTQWLWSRMDRDLGPAPSVLFIGGGGYSLPTKLLEARPAARAVAVELDPLVTQVVRAHLPWAAEATAETGFDAVSDGPESESDTGRLGIVHADGRVFLNETDRRFDAAVMDAFSSESVPAHLATRETYARLAAIVDGPIYVNLIDLPDGRLVRGVHAILREIYPHVEAVQGPVEDGGRTNIVLTASRTPLAPTEGLPDDYTRVQVAPGRGFTDDHGWVGHR
ncbi:MAG: fused MFS/spermidine synthase [Rhodobacterales bacterium]